MTVSLYAGVRTVTESIASSGGASGIAMSRLDWKNLRRRTASAHAGRSTGAPLSSCASAAARWCAAAPTGRSGRAAAAASRAASSAVAIAAAASRDSGVLSTLASATRPPFFSGEPPAVARLKSERSAANAPRSAALTSAIPVGAPPTADGAAATAGDDSRRRSRSNEPTRFIDPPAAGDDGAAAPPDGGVTSRAQPSSAATSMSTATGAAASAAARRRAHSRSRPNPRCRSIFAHVHRPRRAASRAAASKDAATAAAEASNAAASAAIASSASTTTERRRVETWVSAAAAAGASASGWLRFGARSARRAACQPSERKKGGGTSGAVAAPSFGRAREKERAARSSLETKSPRRSRVASASHELAKRAAPSRGLSIPITASERPPGGTSLARKASRTAASSASSLRTLVSGLWRSRDFCCPLTTASTITESSKVICSSTSDTGSSGSVSAASSRMNSPKTASPRAYAPTIESQPPIVGASISRYDPAAHTPATTSQNAAPHGARARGVP